MNRKMFIQSVGGICKNWNWSWSFVNHDKKIVIFGEWDIHTTANNSLILHSDWEYSKSGRKSPAYDEACEYINLITEDQYTLKTFQMIYSDEKQDENGFGLSRFK